MKNKGMIAALGLILVLGIVTTAATRRYIREQAGSERSLTVGPEAMYEAEPFAAEAAENGLAGDAPEPSSKKMAHAESMGTEDRACMQAEGDVSVQSLGEQKEKRADNRAAAKAAEKQSAGDKSDHSVNTGAVVSPVENGIVSPARGASSGTGAGSDRTAEDYRNRLGEIENTIQNLENSGSANTTDAMREAVAYEYRLWDAELNQIYQAIMAVLPDEETDTLRGRERRWIRERDTAAKQAAERYKG
ncbi:lysozyme inhibitor LprI family protein, partial [Clostridium sp. CAG:43]|uniref:lysozyme inhibitor LprI family protein n=1 Tax=Clostridium sp. CAG:43 TaxID=1262805 RepID=UPI002587CE5E